MEALILIFGIQNIFLIRRHVIVGSVFLVRFCWKSRCEGRRSFYLLAEMLMKNV